jgi:cyclic nucleotide-binding protein
MRGAGGSSNSDSVQNGTPATSVSDQGATSEPHENATRFASQIPVTAITETPRALWHNYNMANVGRSPNILKVSSKLKKSLSAAGVVERYSSARFLFDADQQNQGVYLVLKGKVCLSVKDLQKLDRVFPAGSLLGVPATFIGRPYSLAAVAVTDAEVLHVERQKFLELMTEQPELCREATDMLSREVSFIHTALAERRRQKSVSE